MPLCLGKNTPKEHPHTLKLTKYLAPTLPPLPRKVYWEWKIPGWHMFANDQIGDCVFAAIAHILMNWTIHSSREFTPNEQDIIKAYSDVTGYVPGNPATDNGTTWTDALAYWQTTGVAGHKIAGWAQLDFKNRQEVEWGIYLFGAVALGFQMPQTAIDQFNEEHPWNIIDPSSRILGGHAVPLFGYGLQGHALVTWGKIQYESWEFLSHFGDEAYAVISTDWLDQAGKSPSGFDLASLQTDLAAIKSGTFQTTPQGSQPVRVIRRSSKK